MQNLVLLILIFAGALNNASALDYHEPCQPDEIDPPNNTVTSCNYNIGLTCQSGICECDSLENMEYDPILNTCAVLIDGSCAKINPNGQEMDCVVHAYCNSQKICKCYDDEQHYSNSTDRKCMPSKYAPCETTADCNPHDLLTCNLGICGCPNPLHDYFDRDTNMCYTGIEAPCDPNDIPGSGKVTCDIRVAECSADPLSITGFSCQCKDTWLAASDHDGCGKGYMESCSDTTTDSDECLKDGGLQCYQGKCYCENQPDQVWDESKNTCTGTEGVECTIWDDGVIKLCQTGLECIPNVFRYYGICRKTSATSNPVQLTSTSPTSSNPEQSSSTNPTTEVSSSSNTNTQTEGSTSSLSTESTTESTASSIFPKIWNILLFSVILFNFQYAY